MYASLSSTPSSHRVSSLSLFTFTSLFLIRSWQKASRANPILDWASLLSLKRLRRSPARIRLAKSGFTPDRFCWLVKLIMRNWNWMDLICRNNERETDGVSPNAQITYRKNGRNVLFIITSPVLKKQENGFKINF